MISKDFTSFFSEGMGWPIIIIVAILFTSITSHPFAGTTMTSNQPIGALCSLQFSNCSTKCEFSLISVAETCRPVQWGPKPIQVTVPEECPCKEQVYNLIYQYKELNFTGTACKDQILNCTCICPIK